MATETRTPRLAVLIDADNTSPKIASGLFEEIAKIGEASVRRIYGDFSGTRLKSWADILATYAIMPYQNFAYTTGKNASDIALVIDAMDLLHSGRFDGFCLVSSDSDFTRLAARIREQGLDVYGFGAQKTPESFRKACRRFFYTENLLPTGSTGRVREKSAAGPTVIKPAGESISLIRTAIEHLNGDDGWVPLAAVGKQLTRLSPDFDSRTYGHAKLSDLVKKANAFELRESRGGADIRNKPEQDERTPPKKQRKKAKT
jgi:uncharacterized LabA/DUF88 family protein